MKSIKIQDTTKQERIQIIKEWLEPEDGLAMCDIDLYDMYHDYIEGKKEISEINAEYRANYEQGV